MTGIEIPFNKPFLAGDELQYISQAVRGGHSSGDGPFTKRCEGLLEQLLGIPRALLTTSCTAALEMAGLLFNLGQGDEVIIPAFTFVSTANAFALRGVRPVFADIRADTLNIDESQIADRITSRTRAIVVVHYAGVACEMDSIMNVARIHGLPVIEDNAHGLLGRYKLRNLGTFGALATLSFHETKNIICGEGGALLINDSDLISRAEVIREKGTNRARYFRGQVDKYTWVDIGSSFVPSDILAAFLLAQLEARARIQALRKRIWETYYEELRVWAQEEHVRLPVVPVDCEQPFHMFFLLLPSLADRTRLIERLRERGILAVFHYQPLHLSDMGRKFGGMEGGCPVSEYVADRLLRIPFYNDLTEEQQMRVIATVREFRT